MEEAKLQLWTWVTSGTTAETPSPERAPQAACEVGGLRPFELQRHRPGVKWLPQGTRSPWWQAGQEQGSADPKPRPFYKANPAESRRPPHIVGKPRKPQEASRQAEVLQRGTTWLIQHPAHHPCSVGATFRGAWEPGTEARVGAKEADLGGQELPAWSWGKARARQLLALPGGHFNKQSYLWMGMGELWRAESSLHCRPPASALEPLMWTGNPVGPLLALTTRDPGPPLPNPTLLTSSPLSPGHPGVGPEPQVSLVSTQHPGPWCLSSSHFLSPSRSTCQRRTLGTSRWQGLCFVKQQIRLS